jgi:hypothetical protein
LTGVGHPPTPDSHRFVKEQDRCPSVYYSTRRTKTRFHYFRHLTAVFLFHLVYQFLKPTDKTCTCDSVGAWDEG